MAKRMTFFVLIAAILFGFGCSSDNAVGTGNLTLNLSDAPLQASNIKGVYITINDIVYHTSSDTNSANGWASLGGFQGPAKFNLLDLADGNFALLGNLSLPAGKYTQLRFMLDLPEVGQSAPTTPNCYVEFTDGNIQALFVPSGGTSGFKATGEFTVPVNGSVEITSDFDVRKSLIRTGSGLSMRYILQPTIRLIVHNEAGKIAGTVSNAGSYASLMVFAYADGAYVSATEAIAASDSTNEFPNAVTGAKMAADGKYVLAFLAPGTYDLVVVGYSDETNYTVLGYKSNVAVESNKTTALAIDAAALESSLQ